MTSVVGIDFGYQNSLIAAAGRGGVDVLLNGNSQRLNPYVWFSGMPHCDKHKTLFFGDHSHNLNDVFCYSLCWIES